MKEEISKYYYPCCSENGCNGILNIKINDDNFSVNYSCHDNDEHKKENIFYKTFERFYIKEINILKCSKCDINLEKDLRYECKICKKIYCGFCFILDEHIKDNNRELLLINNKCTLHKKDLTLYCTKCHKHLCIFCVEDSKGHDHGYNIENLYKVIPSIKEVDEVKNSIEAQKKIYEEYFSLLDYWTKKIISVIERYKQIIRDKISLKEKLFSNFNRYFNHYAYYKNFKNFLIYNRIDKDLSSAKKFIESNNFENFKNLLDNFLEINNKEDIQSANDNECEIPSFDKIKKFEIINKNYFFLQSGDSVKILHLDEDYGIHELSKLDNTKIAFGDDIESVTCSVNKDKIYVCLSNKKIIKIFNCDLVNKIMELNYNEIKGENFLNDNFLKCIELSNNILAAAEKNDKIISLWNLDNYSNIEKISLNETIGDILLINSDYFISSQPNAKTIRFYNINNLNEEKIINNINSLNNIHCLTSNNNYILVTSEDIISVISIKHKELIQYYDSLGDYYSMYAQCIKIDEDNYIYYLYSESRLYGDEDKIYFEILKLKEDSLVKTVECKVQLNHENKDMNINILPINKNKSFFIFEGRFIIFDQYSLK